MIRVGKRIRDGGGGGVVCVVVDRKGDASETGGVSPFAQANVGAACRAEDRLWNLSRAGSRRG